MTPLFTPVFIDNACRRRGWYVRDERRSCPGAEVIVGGRHATSIEAQTEARRLEVSL